MGSPLYSQQRDSTDGSNLIIIIILFLFLMSTRSSQTTALFPSLFLSFSLSLFLSFSLSLFLSFSLPLFLSSSLPLSLSTPFHQPLQIPLSFPAKTLLRRSIHAAWNRSGAVIMYPASRVGNAETRKTDTIRRCEFLCPPASVPGEVNATLCHNIPLSPSVIKKTNPPKHS